jgi:hypothetical protein
MKTKLDCLNIFLRYLDEATKKGVDLPSTKNADYRDKFNYFLDTAQKYVAGLVKIPAVFQVTQNPIPNLLGLLQGFDIVQYLPGTDKVIQATGAKSYYFEMDNVGTAIIAVNGVTAQTINNTAKRQFTAYKGNITANSTDNVTITFTGSYPYNIRNTALYGYSFPTDEDVPVYTPYVSYDMPDDFMEFDTVIIRTDPRVYDAYISYKWEKNKKIILEYYKQGSFDIHYFKYPATIAADADDSTQLEVEDKAIDLVVLQAGIKATAADNEDLSKYLQRMFDSLAPNIISEYKTNESTVQTVYSMM